MMSSSALHRIFASPRRPASITALLRSSPARAASTTYMSSSNRPNPAEYEPVKQVFISQSSDIFTNLALEDWLYRHHDFEHKHLLLLWRNNPCVVIGRHQNPWTESNVPFLREHAVDLARRNSGGGTVYHDQGNINCTFFTKKSDYQRRRNLDVICGAIRRLTALDVSVNKREDIVLNDTHKISGTAAKLGKDTAYHHCTVLVDVNECKLHDALNSAAEGVDSKATQSVRVPVKNLRTVDPSVSVDRLQETVGYEFLRRSLKGEDGGSAAVGRHRGFQLVRPDEEWFPGLEKLREELVSNLWVFGKTPKFTVKRSFPLPAALEPSISTAHVPELSVELEVVHGVIRDVRVTQPAGLLDPDFDVGAVMHGMTFGPDLPQGVAVALEKEGVAREKREFLLECLVDMIGRWV